MKILFELTIYLILQNQYMRTEFIWMILEEKKYSVKVIENKILRDLA